MGAHAKAVVEMGVLDEEIKDITRRSPVTHVMTDRPGAATGETTGEGAARGTGRRGGNGAPRQRPAVPPAGAGPETR